MDKTFIFTDAVLATTNDTKESPVVPNGKTWVIKNIGACDINLGDNKSSVYVFRFGTDIIRILSLTGNTQEIELRKEFTGDGAKTFNIIRYNKSGFDKEMPCWASAYERS